MKALARPKLNIRKIAFATLISAAILLLTLIDESPVVMAQSPAGQAQNAQAADQKAAFDVASVKANKGGPGPAFVFTRWMPGGHFTATNNTLDRLITIAYQLKPHQLIGGSNWDRLLAEHFDIDAKADGNPSPEQRNLLLQSLLADRFKLAVHHETRQMPVYALVLAKAGKTGPQLVPHTDDSKCPDLSAGPPPPPAPGGPPPTPPCGGFFMNARPGTMHAAGAKVTIDALMGLLAQSVDRPIVDRTGLTGTFDATMDFAPLPGQGPFSQLGAGSGPDAAAPDPSAPPSIFTALQEQLGLKLEAQTGPVDVLVIDHVEEPSAD